VGLGAGAGGHGRGLGGGQSFSAPCLVTDVVQRVAWQAIPMQVDAVALQEVAAAHSCVRPRLAARLESRKGGRASLSRARVTIISIPGFALGRGWAFSRCVCAGRRWYNARKVRAGEVAGGNLDHPDGLSRGGRAVTGLAARGFARLGAGLRCGETGGARPVEACVGRGGLAATVRTRFVREGRRLVRTSPQGNGKGRARTEEVARSVRSGAWCR
jgi:hypothetical protein